MPDIRCVCDTSPLQYLYQLHMLNLLPRLAGSVVVPPAVAQEIMAGRRAGVSLPELTSLDWLEVRQPQRKQEAQWFSDLGSGEAEVLMLGLELDQSIVVLDDARARKVAEALGLKLTGTLGILLDAKRAGYIAAVGPLLDHLDELRFRVSKQTRSAVLELAGEGV